MKNKILTFIIGILIGATVATLGWYMYIKSVNVMTPQNGQMIDRNFRDNRPEMPQGMQNGGTPPEMPTT